MALSWLLSSSANRRSASDKRAKSAECQPLANSVLVIRLLPVRSYAKFAINKPKCNI